MKTKLLLNKSADEIDLEIDEWLESNLESSTFTELTARGRRQTSILHWLKNADQVNRVIEALTKKKGDTLTIEEMQPADEAGFLPVHMAAGMGYADVIEAWLSKGADPNHSDNEFFVTPLILAIVSDNINVVRLLLSKGVKINHMDYEDKTALCVAVIKGNADIVKLLLEAGANIDDEDNNKNSPLLLAAYQGHAEVVRLLLDYKANTNISNNRSLTALVAASQNNHTAIVKLLLEQPDINRLALGSCLVQACYNGNAEIVRLFLKQPNIDILALGSGLHAACNNGNTEIAKLLLKHPNISALALGSGFEAAYEKNNKKIMTLLRDHPRFAFDDKMSALAGLFVDDTDVSLITGHDTHPTGLLHNIRISLETNPNKRFFVFTYPIGNNHHIGVVIDYKSKEMRIYDHQKDTEQASMKDPTLIQLASELHVLPVDGYRQSPYKARTQDRKCGILSILAIEDDVVRHRHDKKKKQNSRKYHPNLNEEAERIFRFAKHHVSPEKRHQRTFAILTDLWQKVFPDVALTPWQKEHVLYLKQEVLENLNNRETLIEFLVTLRNLKEDLGKPEDILKKSDEKETYQLQIVVGPKHPTSQINYIKTTWNTYGLKENTDYVILGDGSVNVSPENIKRAEHTFFFAHGTPFGNTHLLEMDGSKLTADFLENSKDITGVRHVFSCHGGIASAELPEVIMHSGKKYITLTAMCTKTIADLGVFCSDFKKRYNRTPNHYESFAFSILTSPETLYFDGSFEFRVVEMISTLLDKTKGNERKRTEIIRAINSVLQEKGLDPLQQFDDSKSFREALTSSIVQSYPNAKDKLGAFLNDLQKPKSGLLGSNPLKTYKNEYKGFKTSAPKKLPSKEGIKQHWAEEITRFGKWLKAHGVEAQDIPSIDETLLPEYREEHYLGSAMLMEIGRDNSTNAEVYVTMYLEAGVDPNYAMIEGSTGLLLANEVKIAALLLDRGANIEHSNNYGQTALMQTAFNGHTEVVRLLLERGANIEHSNNYGQTALMQAAYKGHTEVVRLLLERGANIEHSNNYGITALMKAAFKGRTEVVTLLLERGANIEHSNNYGVTALMKAAYKGHTEVVRLLLQKSANIEHSDNNGTTALIVAAQNGHTEVVRLLLKKSANIEHSDNNGTTALIIATENAHTKVVKLLLKKSANIEHSDNNGTTALIIATENDHTKVVKLLLEKGANIKQADNRGRTPLSIAKTSKHKRIRKLLCDRAKHIEYSNQGNTPLIEQPVQVYPHVEQYRHKESIVSLQASIQSSMNSLLNDKNAVIVAIENLPGKPNGQVTMTIAEASKINMDKLIHILKRIEKKSATKIVTKHEDNNKLCVYKPEPNSLSSLLKEKMIMR